MIGPALWDVFFTRSPDYLNVHGTVPRPWLKLAGRKLGIRPEGSNLREFWRYS